MNKYERKKWIKTLKPGMIIKYSINLKAINFEHFDYFKVSLIDRQTKRLYCELILKCNGGSDICLRTEEEGFYFHMDTSGLHPVVGPEYHRVMMNLFSK